MGLVTVLGAGVSTVASHSISSVKSYLTHVQLLVDGNKDTYNLMKVELMVAVA